MKPSFFFFVGIMPLIMMSCQNEGCTNPQATNFNEEATLDDGTCYLPGDPVLFDGYSYDVIQIGDQYWFAENLRTTTYASGETLPKIPNYSDWSSTSAGAYCNPNNSSAAVSVYGRFYNRFSVTAPQGLCPTGWHIPSDEDWLTLIEYVGLLGYTGQEGCALRASELWDEFWCSEGDPFSFSSLPAGSRRDDGSYDMNNRTASWWSSTLDESGNPKFWWDYDILPGLDESPDGVSGNNGLCIRCIMD